MKIGKSATHLTAVLAMLMIGVFLGAGTVGAFSLFGNDGATRNDNQGNVMIAATYQGAEQKDGPVSIKLALNTHMVDLSQYDIQRLSYLQFDDQTPIQAAKWVQSGEGHHIRGTLTFAGSAGKSVKKLRLILKGIGGIDQRVFEWQLPLDK